MSFHEELLIIHFPFKSIRAQAGIIINMTRSQKSLTDHQLHETISATGRTFLSFRSVCLWKQCGRVKQTCVIHRLLVQYIYIKHVQVDGLNIAALNYREKATVLHESTFVEKKKQHL